MYHFNMVTTTTTLIRDWTPLVKISRVQIDEIRYCYFNKYEIYYEMHIISTFDLVMHVKC